ncbi:hypothetical protein GBA63_22600 (plasmid) [Rubrobacter tropicus]|uniref:TNase-like domain-containing protein n=1 Tax=Rubrobacter tropicus TaxID=2653851 RepID=A0A6G8QGB2_9ACTN|nr:thermonuclease family protein [Rubrobacter tropicus]QIN85492.1 hypothetical protein GBA63_22600 [Rubrobacter tropicus]
MTSIFGRSTRARALLLWLALAACLSLAPGCSPSAGRDVAADALDAVRQAASSGGAEAGGRPSSSEEVRVTRAVDGDTLEISPGVAGHTDVRLIGVDAPESAIPGETPQPLGKDAAAFTSRALEGRTVVLTFDEELVDPYERLLAYARLPKADHTHNERLVRLGLAQVAIFEPNDALADKLYADQDAARSSDSGIWSLPARQHCQLADRGNGIGEGSIAC